MGSGESKGHSKRKTTTSSGFLGRGRQVQVREVGHQKELVLISITSSHLFSLNSLIFCFASISVVLGNRPTGSIVFFLFCFVLFFQLLTWENSSNPFQLVQKALYLSVNVFSTKSTNWDTILTFPNGDGNAIFCGHPRRSSRLQFSGILIPCVWSGPGKWTRHFPLCSQALYRLFRAYYISFSSSNVGNFFWGWILKDCIKGQFGCRLVFPSSTKREIRYFHVLVMQWRQGNAQKSVMHVQSCCFVNLNLWWFFAVPVDVAVVVA